MQYSHSLLLIFCLALLLTGCDRGTNKPVPQSTSNTPLNKTDSKNEADEIKNNVHFQTAISIADEMTNSILAQRASIANGGTETYANTHFDSPAAYDSTLKEAYENGEKQELAALMGYSAQQISELDSRLTRARDSLYSDYPEIEELAQDQSNDCMTCEGQHNSFFANLADLQQDPFGSRLGTSSVSKDPDNSCQLLPLAATLTLCLGTGPLYPVCAYGAICAWCEGEGFDDICFDYQ